MTTKDMVLDALGGFALMASFYAIYCIAAAIDLGVAQ